MLYIFGGAPRCELNSGGLIHCVNEVEKLGLINPDPAIQYTREGVFIVQGHYGERAGKVEYRLSNRLEADGITWDWFTEQWGFGGGAAVHKTFANRETMLVDHDSGMSVPDLIATRRIIDFGKLRIQMVNKPTEAWAKYEARWLPGTCPQESHIVHLTWLIMTHRLPEFAYRRLERIVEDPGVALNNVEQYRAKDFSPTRIWKGEAPAPMSKEMAQLLGRSR